MPEAGDNFIVESVDVDRDGSVAQADRWPYAFFPRGDDRHRGKRNR